MSTPELEFHVILDPTLTEAPEGAFLYEGDLLGFYHSLISGHAYPLTLATRSLEDVDTLLALAIFMHRDLAIHPGTPGLIASFMLACAEPFWGLAHIDRDLARLILHIRVYLTHANGDLHQQGDRLASALQWIHEYATQGFLPQMAPAAPPPRVLLTGTDGFVLAETKGPRDMGWVELFRMGFFRGALVGQPKNDRRPVTIARKTSLIQFDLERAAQALNAMELAMGEEPAWVVEENFLRSPGTLVLMEHLMLLLTRV